MEKLLKDRRGLEKTIKGLEQNFHPLVVGVQGGIEIMALLTIVKLSPAIGALLATGALGLEVYHVIRYRRVRQQVRDLGGS